MFKNLKIGMKLGMGFRIVLILLAIVSFYNYSSFNSIDGETAVAQKTCNDQVFIVEKEVDHLNWMTGVTDLFLDDEVTEITVETDDHCYIG